MLHQLYKKQVEARKDRFDGHFAYIANALDFYTTEHYTEVRKKGFEHLDDIKSFISSSRHKDTIELIEAEIERKKGMRKTHREFECNGAHGGRGCYETWCDMETCTSKDALECKGYNQAIDDDIKYLQENLQKILDTSSMV